MSVPRGRSTGTNTPNRFARLHVEPDAEALADAPRQAETVILHDTSKSALSKNSSPDIPFKQGLNPYRGCEHGCSYCLAGDTQILMADGSLRLLEEVRAGDRIIGTVRDGWYRRYHETEVRDHWRSLREAYRLTLADGTTIVTSADHRFLTERGWKFVTGAQQGAHRRPHLTPRNKLMGYGTTPSPLLESEPYRRGYLTGMIRGDGHLGHYAYERAGRAHGNQHRFHLVLADREALDRMAGYLDAAGIPTQPFVFAMKRGARAALHGIRTSAAASVRAVEALIAWPEQPCVEWARGFLAGAFDAEGSHGSVIRVSNSDEEFLCALNDAFRAHGFAVTENAPRRPANAVVRTIRVLGGAVERMRFFHLTAPAITRKRTIEGLAVKSSAALQVVAIEPLGLTVPMFDLTTGTGDFVANGVIAHNCYARPTHEYLDLSAGLDFETKIVVKPELPRLLSETLQKPSYVPEPILLSGVTDPYQPLERRMRLTRGCLEVLARHRHPVGIITKNALVTRDVDLLAELAERDLVAVRLSITSLRDEVTGAMEPRTSRASGRLKAVEKLAEAGVPVGVMVAPIIPGLTDDEMPAILRAAADAGATHASYTVVRLPGAVEPLFSEWIERAFPERAAKVLGRIRELRGGALDDRRFGKRMHGEGLWADTLRQLFRLECRRLGLNRARTALSTAHFRRLPHGQGDLF